MKKFDYTEFFGRDTILGVTVLLVCLIAAVVVATSPVAPPVGNAATDDAGTTEIVADQPAEQTSISD